MHLHCPMCRTQFEFEDWVVLDQLNEVRHEYCERSSYPLKDECTYEEICQKYHFHDDFPYEDSNYISYFIYMPKRMNKQ